MEVKPHAGTWSWLDTRNNLLNTILLVGDYCLVPRRRRALPH